MTRGSFLLPVCPRGRVGLVCCAFLLGTFAAGCGARPDVWEGQNAGPKVVTTFAPLACFVRNVGGDDVAVLTLATSVGPHHLEASVDDTLKLRRADLFFVNGLELDEQAAGRMARNSSNPRLKGDNPEGFIEIGQRLLKTEGLVDKLSGHEGHAHDHAHGHDHAHHHHGEYDPHLWLGIPQAKAMVEVIRDELCRVAPAKKEAYTQRATGFLARLDKLHAEGKALLKDKKERSLVTNHESLHYFAKSFGLEIAGVLQIQAGNDIDPARLGELIKTCKAKNVRIIATEPQFSDRGTAQTLKRQLTERGVPDPEVIELDPLETATGTDALKDLEWYEKGMRRNLETLAKALR